MDTSLQDYIQKAKSEGHTNDQIKANLVQAGWSANAVDNALGHDSGLSVPPPPSSKGKTSMWDAFEHILLFISLYVMAAAIAMILHFFVDKYVASGIITGYGNLGDLNSTLLKGYLSALIVSFPLFAFLFLDVTKRTKANPQLRHLDSRKLLIYITLIATFLFMIFSIITIVYSLLNGNITSNFLFHFAVTVLVNAIIFIYYVNQVKEDRKLYE